MKSTRCLALFALSAFVTACGGGGDGGDAGAPAASTGMPLAAAVASIVNQNRTGTVTISGTATASGQTVAISGSGTLAESTSAATFEGTAGVRKDTTINATIVGTSGGASQSAPLSLANQEYWDSNYKPLGSIAAGAYCVTTAYTPVAATAPAGSAGSWYTQDCYSSSAKGTKLGSFSTSYAVDAESGGAWLLRINSSSTSAAGTIPSSRSYRVTSTGAVTRLSDVSTVTLNGVTVALTMTYQ